MKKTSMINIDEIKEIEFLYRDASNYKCYFSLRVGEIDRECLEKLRDSGRLESGTEDICMKVDLGIDDPCRIPMIAEYGWDEQDDHTLLDLIRVVKEGESSTPAILC